MSRAYIPLFIFCNLIMIPLKNELVKCNCICALSALSFLHGKIIICNFFQILGENSLRIYTLPLNCLGCPLPCPCHAEAYRPYREAAAPGHQRFPRIGSLQAVFHIFQKMPLPSAPVFQPPCYLPTFCDIFCTANSPRVSFTGPTCSYALTLPPFLDWCPFSNRWII